MRRCLELAAKYNLIPYKLGKLGTQYAVLGGVNPLRPSMYTFTEDRIISEKKFSSLREGLKYFNLNVIVLE